MATCMSLSCVPSYDQVKNTATYSCDFVYSFIGTTYQLNFIFVSASGSGLTGVTKNIINEDYPTILIVHLNDSDHFEPILEISLTQYTFSSQQKQNIQNFYDLADIGDVNAKWSWNNMVHLVQIPYYVRGAFQLKDDILFRWAVSSALPVSYARRFIS